ncbi:DMT family transporter [Acetobacteraceae bacterium ESL0709]|nr:DMT family transporter [Acetobacteraceae bacterium ESL0697]MDF7678817.1 DMT family transporter [Acetobacteraceae bacterium ESL0709]
MTKYRLPLPSRQEMALAVITMFWGGTYYVLHVALQTSGPFFFVAVRFLVAAFFVILLTGKRCLIGITRQEIINGSLIGFSLVCGYLLQLKGLETITSSRSAFLTALYVPLVPLMQWIFLRKTPHVMSILGLILAFTGLIFLAGPQGGGISLSHGDVLTILGTVAFSIEILLISVYALQADSRRITIVQLVAGGIVAFIGMPLSGESVPPLAWGWVSCVLAMGLLSAAVQLVMNWAQKSVPATRATVIYSTEPIWGGLIGHFMGEALSPTTLLGAFLIICGVIASELRPRKLWLRRTFRGAVARDRMPAMGDLWVRLPDDPPLRSRSGAEKKP